MKIAGVVLLFPLVFIVVFGSDDLVNQRQPEAAPDPVGDFQSNSDDATQDNPPTEDFLALRQRNAELALQVEEMTSELRQLQHDKKMTLYRTKFTVSKIKRRCSVFPVDKKEDSDGGNVKVREDVAMMPWSLTHTATRHKMQSGFPGEGMFKDIKDYFQHPTSAVEAVGSYLRKIPILGAAKDEKKKADEELKTIQAMLKETRMQLGRNKEARHGLEEHYNAVMARITQTKVEADADAAALEQAMKAERDLDKRIEELKEKTKRKQAEVKNQPIDMDPFAQAQLARSEEVQNVSKTLHDEVARRMNHSDKVLETFKFQNSQMETAIEESKARVPDTKMRIQNLKKSMENITENVNALNKRKAYLLHEENEEESNVAKEDHELIAISGQLETCDEWSQKLEKKVKQVVDSNKVDAKLCHKSLLTLHGERVKLKQELHKESTELKKQKDAAASIGHKGDETLDMLNHCLGRLK